jgi:heme-degrading monooxygenase HmoA
VYARSTRFNGQPGNVDAGIEFMTNEAGPALDRIDGCRGLSMLVDRETGECIATSSWESEEAMRASGEQIGPIRDRGQEILGGSVQVDEWEIALMHRSQHGACCRVTWMQGDVDAMATNFRDELMPQLEQTSGFCSASLLLNRSTGTGCATTTWESRDAMAASRSAANDMRNRSAGASGGQLIDVHEFDLAYAHLHVPEMV